MATLAAGMASSHAYTFLNPEDWEKQRNITRQHYIKRYGIEPPDHPKALQESFEENQKRFADTIGSGLNRLRDELKKLNPDVLIIIGDDQDENYKADNIPQFSIYTGDEVTAVNRWKNTRTLYSCRSDLAYAVLEQSLEAHFDLSASSKFDRGELHSHAHWQPLSFLDREGTIPIIPVFVNAIHVPGPTPARCYQFGQRLRRIIDAFPKDLRVVVYASGGLSHFTAGYPYAHYKGPLGFGSISEEFDYRAIDLMKQGSGHKLAELLSEDLLNHGNVEMRQWIVFLGLMGSVQPEWLLYEPFYRGMLGMSVGYWDLQKMPAPVR